MSGATGTDLRGEEAGALTFTTPVLKKNLEITGPIAVKVAATATTTDFDWVVRVTDVAPDGSSNWITDARLRAALRDGLDRAQDVPLAQPVDYAIDVSPTSAVFRAGHRLRIDLLPVVHAPAPSGAVTVDAAKSTVTLPVIPNRCGRSKPLVTTTPALGPCARSYAEATPMINKLLLAAIATLVLAAPASATTSATLSKRPLKENARWRALVEDPSAADVYGKTADGKTSFTVPGGGSVVLDLGVNTGGYVQADVKDGAGTIHLAYAEARRFLTPLGDTIEPSLGGNDNPDGRTDVVPAAPGTHWQSPAVRGGERWILVSNDGPAPVTLDGVKVHVTHLRATPDDYAGHFLSSDNVLNRAWYASAYTFDASVTGDPNVVMDGAKRDRMAFIGDLALAQGVGLNTVKTGPAIARDSLWIFSCAQKGDGFVPGSQETTATCPKDPPDPGSAPATDPLRSGEYVAWYIVAAGDYDRLTGDHATTRKLLPILRRAVGYLTKNEVDGLYTVKGDAGWYEYNWRANSNFGTASYTNIVYYRALKALADLERRVGDGAKAADADDAHAAAVKQALMAKLWDKQAGAFLVNTDDDSGNHAQDANVQAIVAGLLDKTQAASALKLVDTKMKTKFGTKNSEQDDDSFVTQYISPFTGSWELDARFRQDDALGALDLIRREWGHMVYTDPKSTVWEKMALDGTPQPNYGGGQGLPTTRPEGEGYVSLAHAWSAGPVPALSHYVLGARDTGIGYDTWTVAPQLGDLHWAQGQVPTPHGPLVSRWRRGNHDSYFRLTVTAPKGTRGTVVIPLLGKPRTIARDGKVIAR